MERAAVEAVAFDVYQYAYPLVTMEITRRQATNVPSADSVPGRAPMNQFAHFRSYPVAEAQDVVRLNFDTRSSFVWLDLRDEPLVVSVPESPDRYYLTPTLDVWTDVFAEPGTRTTGGLAADFALVAPGWQRSLPDGVEMLRCPTPMVWIMGRTQTNGPADYGAVHAVQDQFRVTPLSAWGGGVHAADGLCRRPRDRHRDAAARPGQHDERHRAASNVRGAADDSSSTRPRLPDPLPHAASRPSPGRAVRRGGPRRRRARSNRRRRGGGAAGHHGFDGRREPG
jgi:hypothetical protein